MKGRIKKRRIFKNNTSGFRGVSRTKSGRWWAQIWFNGKPKNLGRFEAPEEAYAVYCEEKKRLFGEFARFE